MEYPVNLADFENKFSTEDSRKDYLFNLKYKDGYTCTHCGSSEYWIVEDIV